MKLLLFVAASSVIGCASVGDVHKRWSSGEIGCPESEVAVSNESDQWGAQSWIAECRGKRFYCSTPAGQAKPSCKEDLKK